MAQSYEKAGVNLEAGYEVVRRIKKHVAFGWTAGAGCGPWRSGVRPYSVGQVA